MPAWLHLLSEQEQAEFKAAWPDALAFEEEGLSMKRRRVEYLAVPDPSGKRALTLERLQTAWNTYHALSRKGRRLMQKQADHGVPTAQDPP
jgi:hypothetical protein